MDKSDRTESPAARKLAKQWGLMNLALLAMTTIACFGCQGLALSILLDGFGQSTVRVERTAAQNVLAAYVDFSADGVFTPTQSVQLNASTAVSDVIGFPSFWKDLAANGYMAIRVPHMPPTYTPSSLIAGDGYNDPVVATYFLPPDALAPITVTLPVTRSTTDEALINSRYPITDAHSHWEVWRLTPGAQWPIPAGPFRLKPGFPPSLELAFRIDFKDADAYNCAGCLVQVVAYNGYNFIGPFEGAINFEDASPSGNPQVGFGARCADVGLDAPSIVQYLTPTVPFTHTFALENYAATTRTFTITTSSSQGWSYTYYRRAPNATLISIGNLPFTVAVGPASTIDWPFAGCLNIFAVGLPSISITDTQRETLIITATSIVSPTSVHATGYSVALAPAYQLDENHYQYHVYLPLVLK